MQTLLWTFYLIPKPQGMQTTAQGATGPHKYLKEQKAAGFDRDLARCDSALILSSAWAGILATLRVFN